MKGIARTAGGAARLSSNATARVRPNGEPRTQLHRIAAACHLLVAQEARRRRCVRLRQFLRQPAVPLSFTAVEDARRGAAFPAPPGTACSGGAVGVGLDAAAEASFGLVCWRRRRSPRAGHEAEWRRSGDGGRAGRQHQPRPRRWRVFGRQEPRPPGFLVRYFTLPPALLCSTDPRRGPIIRSRVAFDALKERWPAEHVYSNGAVPATGCVLSSPRCPARLTTWRRTAGAATL